MSSTKPYLLRAMYEWAEDNLFTPQVLVNADMDGVLVPKGHVVEGQIVLNVGSSAVNMHSMDNDALSFSARFNGKEENIYLPMNAIAAIFARENSQGIFFDEQDSAESDKGNSGKDKFVIANPEGSKNMEGLAKSDKTKLSDVSQEKGKPKVSSTKKRKSSHLKIIK